jgi:thiamine-phosphate pyrophosphorylase
MSFRRPCVYAVSSRKRLAPDARTLADEVKAWHAWVEDVVEAGVDILQIREPDLCARDLRDLVRAAVRRAEGRATAILVNDRADVAAVAGAQGVHLPARGLPSGTVRRLARDWLIGRSVHDEEMAEVAAVDYVLYGTLFPSRSKTEAHHRLAGLEGLERAVRRFACPVVAIGGITGESVQACAERGAAGVAAIGLFLPAGVEPESVGPARAVRLIRESFGVSRPAQDLDLLE